MMGESSSCILRPLSQNTSASFEANQGEHIRALTSSISFGRYMSESLEWEKWSTFTHNRYKEEAQRYSKPGSVAQMKAYFEAHYKKKAADRAASLNGKQNSASNLEFISETENQKFPVMDQDLVPEDSHVGTGETDKEIAATEDVIVAPIEVSKCTPCEKGRGAEDAQILNDENSLLDDPVAITDQHNSEQKGQEDTLIVKAEEPLFADCEDVRNPVMDQDASEQNKMRINAVGKLGDSGSLDKSTILSTKSSSHTVVPKPPVPPKLPVSLQKRKDNNAKLDRKGTADKDKSTILSTKSSSRTVVPKPPVPPKPPVSSIQKRKDNNAKLHHKGTASDMEGKKRTMSRLLRLPRNFTNETKKLTNETKKPMSPIIEKILNSKLVRTLAGNASKVSRGKPVWDSVETPPHAAATTFQDRIVRHLSPLHQSISNNGKEEAKSQSPFVSRSKSPGALGKEARPSIVAHSLSFKTEERAAKRKEFYERLEQKSKIIMSEKEKLQEQAKGKARSDLNRKSESSKTSINVMKKVSTALPCSPTFGRKTPSKSQDNSSRLQDNYSQSPWRRSTLACSSAGMKTPSELQDNISRSPWKYTTHPSSTIADRKTPSKLQDNNSRSPWRHTTTLPSSSSVDRKTPSKLQDNNSRSPWRHTTTLPSSSNVDRKTPSRVQENNSRPPWRLASKSKCNKETIEMNNRSPYHLERSVSKKSTHENSSPNIQV